MAQTRSRKRRGRSGAKEGSIAGAILQASRRYRVPLWILVGVKLLETGSGSGEGAVSSTGANGPFQLEPATQHSLGVKDPNNVYEAAAGAAKLLRQNKNKFGSWNAALEAYNGGPGAVGKGYAYNEADLKEKLHEFGADQLLPGAKNVSFPGNVLQGELELMEDLFGGKAKIPKGFGEAAGEAGGAAGEAVGGIGSALSAVGDFFSILTQGETWIRLAEIIAGAVLLYMGLRSLTGVGASDLPGAAAARRAVPV